MISVLITTFNRKPLLARALKSVQGQTYQKLDIVVIDDGSTDGTDVFVESLHDPRIRYYRNRENQGSLHGDRIHLRRFVNELARGDKFVYLCDDDYWKDSNLLERQLKLFDTYPNVAMVIGGQLSNYPSIPGAVFHSDVYPKPMMTAAQFLEHFSNKPIECNIVIGATLYDKEKFQLSGALADEDGPRWQAGYEMLIAPGSMGNVGYINESCVVVEVTRHNASFRGTQLEHYLDSVKSVEVAFKKLPKSDYYAEIRRKTLNNIAKAYLANAETIRMSGRLTMCSRENISRPVTEGDIIHA